MQAQIRFATRKEVRRFLRPKVCVVGDEVHYSFEAWTGRLTDLIQKLTLAPTREGRTSAYTLPDGTTLRITKAPGCWLFNGQPLQERWPTTHRRELVTGTYVIKVRPEDDALFIDATDGHPDIGAALVAFYASIPTAD